MQVSLGLSAVLGASILAVRMLRRGGRGAAQGMIPGARPRERPATVWRPSAERWPKAPTAGWAASSGPSTSVQKVARSTSFSTVSDGEDRADGFRGAPAAFGVPTPAARESAGTSGWPSVVEGFDLDSASPPTLRSSLRR